MKKYSLKFWIFFWLTSAIFLSGWYLYWNIRHQGLSAAASGIISFLPIDPAQKKQYQTLATLGDYFSKKDGEEKIFLVLFQNNLEIRPGGGFIGAFGIVKMKDGRILSLETHDLSNFDARIPNTLEPPYPMKETLRVSYWKMRDSNFSPDFAVNARKAQEFYRMGQGRERFDGVVGITADVLTSMLRVTGPVFIEGYPGTYDSENAILALEYQVEKAFEEQGIGRGERKSIMNDLAREIEKRIFTLSIAQKIGLAEILIQDLRRKDIQLYFEDPELQKAAAEAGWAGLVDQDWNKDYLMTVDANLGSFKSDYYVKRSLDYAVDLSEDVPTAKLKITYEHTARQKDWMTRDYTDYLRVYLPGGAWFTGGKNFDDVRFGNELNKKYFGAIVRVPIGSSRTVEINYTLPQELAQDYALKIQKQAGISGQPVAVHIIDKNGGKKDFEYIMDSDIVVQN